MLQVKSSLTRRFRGCLPSGVGRGMCAFAQVFSSVYTSSILSRLLVQVLRPPQT